MVIQMTNIKTYSELITLPTFEQRYEYLRLDGSVGVETFGFDRYINQKFYHDPEWIRTRDKVITRDNGCDLGVRGYEIKYERIIIHHITPITLGDIINRHSIVFDLENLITVTHNTHLAIHYGDKNIISKTPIERTKYDTCPWKIERR